MSLTREAQIAFIDDGPGKPEGMYRHIGRRPIFAFGNSDGDQQMLEYTAAGAGARFWVSSITPMAGANGRTDRESHVGRLAAALDEGRRRDWTVVDMARDWKVIYPHEIAAGRCTPATCPVRVSPLLHGTRTHLSIEKDPPTPRRVHGPAEGRVVANAVHDDGAFKVSARQQSDWGVIAVDESLTRRQTQSRVAGTTMPISMQHERDNIYRVEVSGVLKKSDLDRSQALLVAEMGRIGSTRLLFILQEFEGWEANPNWGDLTFYVKHGDSIERIAIVGDERWRSEALMFASADLRRAPVEFFSESALAEARAWLSA